MNTASPWVVIARSIANRPGPYVACFGAFLVFFNSAILVGLSIEWAFEGIEAGDRGQVWWAALALAASEALRLGSFHPGMWTFAAYKSLVATHFRVTMLDAQVASGGPDAARPVSSPAAATPQFRDDPEELVLLGDGVLDFVGGLVFAVIAVGLMGSAEPTAAIVAIGATLLVAAGSAGLDRALKAARRAERDAEGRLTELLGDLLGSAATVSVNGATGDASRAVDRLAIERRRHAVRSRVLESGIQAFAQGLGPIALALVLLLGLPAVVDGRLGAAELALFATYFSYLSILPRSAGTLLARRSQATVSIDKMSRIAGSPEQLVASRSLPILARDPEPDPAGGAVGHGGRDGSDRLAVLEVRGLSVRAGGGAVLVPPTDLRLDAGTMTVVAGEVGAGKSLLVRALLGQLDRTDLEVAGEVWWNGKLVADRAAWFVPPHSAYVAQQPAFLTDTVLGNITLGADRWAATDPSAGSLRDAVAAAQLGPDLEDLGAGIDTMIGPRGVKLSGGQRQRLAVARALYAGADLVVLDDVSSALDLATEAALWADLRAAGATVLATSNRSVALRTADQVLTLSPGGVPAR